MKRIFLLSSVLCASIFTACSTVKVQEHSYPMAVILPMNGSFAKEAKQVLKGMQLAVEEAQLANDKALQLIVRDCSDEGFDFTTTYEAMLKSGVQLFNVGFSDEVIKHHIVLSENKDIFVNFLCGYPAAVVMGKNSTRIFLNTAQQIEMIADILPKEDEKEVSYILMSVNDNFGKSAGDYLNFNIKREKVKCYNDVFSANEKDFDIFVRQIIRFSPDCLFYVGYGNELQALLDYLEKTNYKKNVVAITSFENQAKSENIKLFQVKTLFELGKINSEKSKSFVERYRQKYGEEPTWLSAYGYDSITLLNSALKKNNYNVANLRANFVNAQYDGAMGVIKFDELADCASELEIVED